jgi:hypothetical protein
VSTKGSHFILLCAQSFAGEAIPGLEPTSKRQDCSSGKLYPRVLYRILFFVMGSFVIWDSIWQFLRDRGQVDRELYQLRLIRRLRP